MNQKVAGSNPAEHAFKNPANMGFSLEDASDDDVEGLGAAVWTFAVHGY